ncbi:MAG: hypothetical protein K9J82_12140 [Methylotenera sp.]|jgi:hypothetical protein|nr:hypothetical protein [Methylotenera sp.]
MNTNWVAEPRLGLEDGWTDIGLLGPGLVSVLALVMAVGASTVPMGLLHGLLGLQAVLLALAAAMTTSSAAVWATRWRARVAPSRGEALARQRMCMQLWVTGVVGLLGLLALAARAEVGLSLSLARVPEGMLAVLTFLLAAQVLGAWCGLAWRGLADRWVLWGWCVLGLALADLGSIRAALAQAPWLAALSLLALGVIAYPLPKQLGRGQPSWAGIPVAPVRPLLRTHPLGATLLPFTDCRGTGGNRPAVDPGPAATAARWDGRWTASYFPSLLLSQVVMNPLAWAAHAWGQSVDGLGLLAYPAWIVLLILLAGGSLWHPGLHWRQRLAPGAWSPLGWAVRMLLSNLVFGLLWLTAGVVAVVWLAAPHQQALMAGTWLTVLGDVTLAGTTAVLLRAWRNQPAGLVLGALGAGGGVLIIVLLAAWVGHPLVRGPAWLAVQLLLSVAFGIAAVQRWVRRDLNPLAEHG